MTAHAKSGIRRRREHGRPRAAGKKREVGASGALVPRASSIAAVPAMGPFGFMRRLADEMDRLFEDVRLGAPPRLPRVELPFERREAAGAAWFPAVEIVERGGKLVVRAELPGLTENDVQVEARDGALCISGERRYEHEENRAGYHRSERSYGTLYREIPLPEGTDPEKAKASFRDGVLEVVLPAPVEAAKGRRVPIEESRALEAPSAAVTASRGRRRRRERPRSSGRRSA